MRAALEVSGLSVRYGGVTAVDSVSLTLHEGELCGVIGPNGAGKTTLFDAVSGLTPAAAGRVTLFGRDITDASPVRRARLGMTRTYQRPQVFGRLTVLDNLVAAQDWSGGGGGVLGDALRLPRRMRRERERRSRAAEVLELCGLASVADVPAGSLPIGVARMLELGRAIATGVRVLLLDEPTSGLDHHERERFAGIVDDLRRTTGCAVLVVEHDVAYVMDHCDRITVLDVGAVLASGPPAEIRDHDEVRAAYLG